MDTVPALFPRTKNKVSKPRATLVSRQDGMSPGRIEALARAFQSGRKSVFYWMPCMTECPIKGDEELAKQWMAGRASVPDGGYEAFQAGRYFGLMGDYKRETGMRLSPKCKHFRLAKNGEQIRKPSGPLAAAWDEGVEEGLRVADSQSPEDLSYGRGFYTGFHGEPTIDGPISSEWWRGNSVGASLRKEVEDEEYVALQAKLAKRVLKEETAPLANEADELDRQKRIARAKGVVMASSVPQEDLARLQEVKDILPRLKMACPYEDEQLEAAWLEAVEDIVPKLRVPSSLGSR